MTLDKKAMLSLMAASPWNDILSAAASDQWRHQGHQQGSGGFVDAAVEVCSSQKIPATPLCMRQGGSKHLLCLQELAAERARRAAGEERLAALAASEQRLQQRLEQAQAEHQAEKREAEQHFRALQGEGIGSCFGLWPDVAQVAPPLPAVLQSSTAAEWSGHV